MDYIEPRAVDLTPDESVHWASLRPYIDRHASDYREWKPLADAMEALTASLLKRDAIPRARLAIFADSKFAEAGSASHRQGFERGGARGRAIWRHPNFLPFLRHFIEGPSLPQDVIAGLCRLLNDDAGTSGMVMDQYRSYARACVRRLGVDRRQVLATELFRLGVEIGMEVPDAKLLRDAARSAR